MVVLSDGENTVEDITLDRLLQQIGSWSEAGSAPKIFTIAFGSDADREVLQRIAEVTGGKQYDSDPRTINDVYGEIATFF
jgi:Ca-activated chloride channel family protein